MAPGGPDRWALYAAYAAISQGRGAHDAPVRVSVRPVDGEAGPFYTSIVIERRSQSGFAGSGRRNVALMNVFLPVASVDVNALLLVGVGATVGFVQGMLGSGGFLLTPLLIMMGISPQVAAASAVCAIAGASVSGTFTHLRAGHVDMKMGLLLLVGGVTGGAVGTVLTKILRALGNLDVVIISCYVLFMAVIGVTMFVGGLTSHVQGDVEQPAETAVHRFLGRLPFRMSFKVSRVETSALSPLILGGVVGVLAAIMGVGGGFILLPAMSYFLGMPMQVVVGTSLFQMLFTSASVTLMQAAVNHSVDAVLAAALLIGSTVGAQLGARTVTHLKGSQLKVAFSMIVLAMSLKLLNDLMQAPPTFLIVMGLAK